MKPEEIKEITKFIKERINDSFFPEEKVTLYKGLKLLNLSLSKYLQLQMQQFSEEQFDSGEIPELNVLDMPNAPIFKKLNSLGMLKKDEEKTMEDFAAVQLTLSVIMFEYFRTHFGKKDALEYAKYLVRSINKLKTRIGTEPPKYVKQFVSNMSIEIKFLEEDLSIEQSKNFVMLSREELERIQKSFHYMPLGLNRAIEDSIIQKTVHPIHFEDYSGTQFERLVFAYVLKSKKWDTTPEWLGQVGSDSGRDIWAIFNGKSHCYVCANFRFPNITKAKSDIDKLKKYKYIPNNLIILFGGSVSADLRLKIKNYAKKSGIESVEVWSGVELEEKLRHEAPELIKRFVEGEEFPDTPQKLINYIHQPTGGTDEEIITMLAECFDRPAFTTPFYRESSITQFEIAITRTIEVLNTGVHRLNDGTLIRTITSRHKIGDEKLKSEFALITQLVVHLRDKFSELKRKQEIRPCNCGQEDCSIYMLTDNACSIMDESRRVILEKFKNVMPNFNIKLP